MSAYDYLLKSHLDLFIRLGSQENNPNPLMVVKYFTPDSSFTWFASEFDSATGMFFGFVVWFDGEWWYFPLQDLQSVRGQMGLRVERDLYFDPTPFSELGL